MKVQATFPQYTARNADFVTGRRKEGRVLDFQVDLETLPATGMLCVHEDTILMAVRKLGYEIRKDEEVLELVNAEERIEVLTADLARLKTLITNMRMEGFVEAREEVDA